MGAGSGPRRGAAPVDPLHPGRGGRPGSGRGVALKALVLAAGRSTRIESLSAGRPKPLLEVAGRSLLEWNLRWLAEAGFGPIWVNLHYRAEEVERAVVAMARGVAAEVRCSREDPILGTAGAWRNLAAEWQSTSIVVYGDNVTRFDLGRFVAAHRNRQDLATIALYDPSRHANTGIAGSRVVVEDGRVVGFEEIRGGAAGAALVNTGAYLLEPAMVDRIAPGFSDFGADIFPAMAAHRVLGGHVIEEAGFCLGLDTPQHFEVGRRLVMEGVARLDHGPVSSAPGRP